MKQVAVGIDGPRLAVGEADTGVPIQSIDEGLKEAWVGIIVRLGEPDVFAIRMTEAEVPLLEGAAIVLSVEDSLHPRVFGIRLDHLPTVVGRGIVEDDQLEVLKGLIQDAVKPPGQVPCVIVVRSDDGYLGHHAGPLWERTTS